MKDRPFSILVAVCLLTTVVSVESARAAKDPAMINSRPIQLANTGLSKEPLKGKIIGPFQSIRSTTVPWPFRHMMGQQINGAPEPLVYAPVYKFVPDGSLPKPSAKDMFARPGHFSMEFQMPVGPNTRTFQVMGNNNPPAANVFLSPSLFQTMAPQPPPFVPPVPPDPNNVPEANDSGSESGPPTESFLQIDERVEDKALQSQSTRAAMHLGSRLHAAALLSASAAHGSDSQSEDTAHSSLLRLRQALSRASSNHAHAKHFRGQQAKRA